MSNYSSLFRVLSPSRVQTKFEENSLPASPTLNPKSYIFKMKKVLTCFVMGKSLDEFTIVVAEEIPIDNGFIPIKNFDVGLLKKHIWKEISYYFDGSGIVPSCLNLWKAEIPVCKENKKVLENPEIEYIKQTFNLKKLNPSDMFLDEEVFPDKYTPPQRHIHIIVQPPATTVGSSSVPAKRQGEPQDCNRKPVAPLVRDFWNKLSEAQIILKFPKNFDKTAFTPSKYMKIEGDEIVLDNGVMLNSQDKLIFNDGEPVPESVELLNFVKFLRFRKSPKGIVYGIKSLNILIKKSYLQMIEKLETDRINEEIEGCTIVGSPGIGKTHYSLYLAFYITRRYSSADFVYQQLNEGKSYTLHINRQNKSVNEFPLGLGGEYLENSYYIADSVIPSLFNSIFTFLVTTPKSDRWEQFIKMCPRKYYAPIWTEQEIWDVWEWNDHYKNRIPETQVRELIKRWGCIPRRVFVEYNDEPDLDRLLSLCDIHKYLQNDGAGLHDNYSGKIIHIIPNDDFTQKEYVAASNEMSKALYSYYVKHTKETIVKIIRDFARTAGGPLAGKLFEMMAHDILRKGGDFKVQRLAEKDDNLFSEETLQLRELKINQFREIGEVASDYYNIPEVENFESVDSIVPVYGDQANYLYQMTIAKTHSIKVNGLTKLKDKMDMSLPIHLYFVVPNINDMFDNYYLQDYITKERKKYVGWDSRTNWIRNIIQYVLLIDLSDF